MSFLNKLSALIPFSKKTQVVEYFFALNISQEKLTAALWVLEGKNLKVLDIASDEHSSLDDLTVKTDKLLDQVLGENDFDVQKILFGVPSAWLSDENLKDEYLKVLRGLIKELELTPMAYVESLRALGLYLEKKEGVPTTAILVGFETHHLTVTVLRAGKLDGMKVVTRGDNLGSSIEKALLNFTHVETLPSKILIYGPKLSGLKEDLLSYPWMSKLSFLHYPKIENLDMDVDIKSVCLAGATEINEEAILVEHKMSQSDNRTELISDEKEEKLKDDKKELDEDEVINSGFVIGDVAAKKQEENPAEDELLIPEETSLAEIEDFQQDLDVSVQTPIDKPKHRFSIKKFIPRNLRNVTILGGIIVILLILAGSYLFLPKADIKIFVEPKIVENDTQVTADPGQKDVNEDSKIIPGKLVDTESSGFKKDTATGKKQVGDPAKGVVKIINNSDKAQTFSKGTIISTKDIKFSLNLTVNVASTSAFADSKSTTTAEVTAVNVGADGNLPSGTQFNSSLSDVAIIAQGNFSGGTSKEVIVVSDADQKRLLASLSSDLRKQAQQKLQEKLPNMKILEEALAEEVIKKSFSKNVNDQASEFSLNLTVKYKGTAFEDKDLKLIVSKLVNTQVPEGFQLNLEDTETQADVSKLEKDGKVIFLARFKAKLLPTIDIEKVKNQIKGKSLQDVSEIIKKMDNVLGSEIKFTPSLPTILQRMPLLSKNIKIEVGLK